MDMKYKVALIAIPAMLVFSGAVYAAYHDGVIGSKDPSEVQANEVGSEMTMKGKAIYVDQQMCQMIQSIKAQETGADPASQPLSCFVLESDDQRTWAFVSQTEGTPGLGETVVVDGKLRMFFDAVTCEIKFDAFGHSGGMSQNAGSTEYCGMAQAAKSQYPMLANVDRVMWLDSTSYHETWVFG